MNDLRLIEYRWSRLAIKSFPCNMFSTPYEHVVRLMRKLATNLMDFIFPHLLQSYDTRANFPNYSYKYKYLLRDSLTLCWPHARVHHIKRRRWRFSPREFAAGATPFGFARSKIRINFNDRADSCRHSSRHRIVLSADAGATPRRHFSSRFTRN